MKYLVDDSPEHELLERVARRFHALTRQSIDVQQLLTQRARHSGWCRSPGQSVGGSCHLMLTADEQWVALNMARPEDHQLLAIFFDSALRNDGQLPVTEMRTRLADIDSDSLLAFAGEVGLPFSRLGETKNGYSSKQLPIEVLNFADREQTSNPRSLTVVDLSSLWAGPLCSRLLQDAGHRVFKVESTHRRDGARRGQPDFYHELNTGKSEIVIDFDSVHGRQELSQLIESADVVIEASRPRALQQLGIEMHRVMSDSARSGTGPRIWLSLTGYGRADGAGHRVGFGDDCAVAGGLVEFGPHGPEFLGDAVADPISGLIAATAIFEALEEQKTCMIEVSLAKSAAWLNSVRKSSDSQRD